MATQFVKTAARDQDSLQSVFRRSELEDALYDIVGQLAERGHCEYVVDLPSMKKPD